MRSTSTLLILIGLLLGCPSGIGLAQPTPTTDQKVKPPKRKRRFIPPTPPLDLSTPGQRSSASSRNPGSKPSGEEIVAIVPEFERVVDFLPMPQVWVLTATPRPTFWFYVRNLQGATVDFQVEQVKSRSDRLQYSSVYQRSVPISKEGLLSITLPDSFAGLEAGERYRWSIRPSNPNLTSKREDFSPVKGWVEVNPLSPELQKQLKTATPIEVINRYTQNGIWLDGFTVLARLYERDPKTYQDSWTSLITEINLDEVIELKP